MVLMHLLALGAFWPPGASPPVARENVVPDRQWPKKHPSGQQAQGKNIRLFVGNAGIAADSLW